MLIHNKGGKTDSISIGDITSITFGPTPDKVKKVFDNFNGFEIINKSNGLIVFNLSKPSFVKISLTDVLGKSVIILEGAMLEAGLHKFHISSNKNFLSRGIYLLKAETDDKSIFKKVIYNKG